MAIAKLSFSAFKTDLGWFGVAWEGTHLAQLTFAHAQQSDVKSALSQVATSAIRKPAQLGKKRALTQVLKPTDSQRDLIDRLTDYASGACVSFDDVQLRIDGTTTFQRSVLDKCRRIPWGQTKTYGQLAADAGSPRAARAAGSVMASNRFPIIIPCHRVIASGQKLGGFSAPGGIGLKQRLLNLESS